MAEVIEITKDDSKDYLKHANALYEAGELDEAYLLLDKHLMLNPNDAQALTVASAILKKANKPSIAYSLAKRATEIKPERSEPWNALGHCAQQLWRIEEARDSYRKALQRVQTTKHRATYLNNLGSTFIDVGDYKTAEGYCKQSLDLMPDDTQTRHNMGLCLLAQHRWDDGWPYYSASVGTQNRLKIKYRGRENPEPEWDGSKGKTVVIYGEQGLGDEICSGSMLPEAIRDCRKVIIDCDHRLENLYKRSFPKASVYGTRWAKPGSAKWKEKGADIDASIAGFEIGRFYRRAAEDFSPAPYLIADPERVAMWRSLFASKGKPAIGIAWTGGTWNNGATHRELPVAQWRPIFDSIDAHWVSLQYKDASADIDKTPIVQYKYATLTADYDDTAALVAALDAVVSVPTAVVHLAGALGTPTFAMMSSKPCWKFVNGLIWHPEVHLIPNDGNWAKTVTETAKQLQVLAK
jgi:tetratricopeptide (TPR) repeat protein